jgi:hypothetical protein
VIKLESQSRRLCFRLACFHKPFKLLFCALTFSKAKTMTFSSKSSSPPALSHTGFERLHDHRNRRHHFSSTPPQLTLVDALAMQAQAQAQASPSGGVFAAIPIWTGGDAASASSEERETLALAAMIAVLYDGTTPADRHGDTGNGRESPDRSKHNPPNNPPSEPSAQ